MIDCQMSTPHLASLGAREIRRDHFATLLRELLANNTQPMQPAGHWPTNGASQPWN
jgi:leucyl/phenylalanyl-tRNA--protein transferase